MNAPVTFETRISQYVRLRDRIREIEKRHKEELEPFKAAKDKLEVMLLGMLNTTGQDSATAKGAGTVYKTTKRSASIADADAFRRHVIGSEAWDLLDWKANATATADFIDEHGTAPPGVNFNTHVTVGVRRD